MLVKTPVETGRRCVPYRLSVAVACLLAFTVSILPAAHAGENALTLSDALSSTLAQNPRLQVFDRSRHESHQRCTDACARSISRWRSTLSR